MIATIRREERDQPTLMELYSVVRLHFAPNQQVFAELITTDVTVQLDMPVPPLYCGWEFSNEPVCILLYGGAVTCPRQPHTRQLLPLFLPRAHLAEKARPVLF